MAIQDAADDTLFPPHGAGGTPTSIRWLIVSLAGLMSIVAGIDRANISILPRPLIAGHHVTGQLLGLANSLFLLMFSLTIVLVAQGL